MLRNNYSSVSFSSLGTNLIGRLKILHVSKTVLIIYSIAATFLIPFNMSIIDESLRAVCMLYFVWRYINESAGTSRAASNIRAVFAVSGRRAFRYSLTD